MRREVRLIEAGGTGPRVLFLPGLGARGTGFRALAAAMSTRVRAVIVDYPDGEWAGVGAATLAREVLEVAGPVAGLVASSFGGMVAAHLGALGATRGIAFLGSFTDPAQLGVRGRLIPLMGPIATFGRPGLIAAAVAAQVLVPAAEVSEIVPTTARERRSVWHRAWAIPGEPAAPSLRGSALHCIAIQGARDLLVPPSVLARLANALPLATPTHLLRDAGHVPYYTHPADCARLLAGWSASIRG